MGNREWVVWVVVGAVIACGGDSTPDATPDTVSSTPPSITYVALQVASLGDSARATRMRDSLERVGWSAYVRQGESGGKSVWRVRMAAAPEGMLPRLVAFALRQYQIAPDAVVVRDSGALGGIHVTSIIPVNRGSHGMTARVRWALSPDRRKILVVEDATSVEAEAAPNGFVMASEFPMRRAQMDSVWDVAPSPDWSRAAFGRAYVLRAGEADSLPTAVWAAFAKRLGMPVQDVRSGSFPASGMAYMAGFSQPGILHLSSGEREVFPVAAGWRVGWSRDGSRMAAGRAPEHVSDDAPATIWVALDTADGRPRGAIPDGATLFDPGWVEGPVIDISVPVDTVTRSALPVEQGQIESKGGWIRVRGRIIGPGVALAATLRARYVVALVPNPDAGEFDPKHLLVLYTLSN